MAALWIDLGIILILIAGIARFRRPRAARAGNLMAAAALLCAVIVVLYRHGLLDLPLVASAAVLGSVLGAWVAVRIGMVQIPAMVALQNGSGGVAAFLVSFVELHRGASAPLALTAETAALLGLVVGTATFTGSLVAAGKLAQLLRQTPTALPRHNWILIAGVAVIAALAVWAGAAAGSSAVLAPLVALLACAALLGIVLAVRVGGADMPVLVSFLNATSGLAAALCGIAIGNRLLIACGATVAASGAILTHVMCGAMNRSLAHVFTGLGVGVQPAARPPEPPPEPPPEAPEAAPPADAAAPSEAQAAPAPADAAPPAEAQATPPRAGVAEPALAPGAAPPAEESAGASARAAALLREARRVIIIPGYGMALAEAQDEVVQLGERLSELGKEVLFAVHPVAGRMPGHMHVLLAEAEVDYGMLREMKDVNEDFARTDVALVVGACDVVNTAAEETSGTSISGMRILRAHEARRVIVCNLDERPGYSGVPNPLYRNAKTILLLGDAKETISRLMHGLEAAGGAPA